MHVESGGACRELGSTGVCGCGEVDHRVYGAPLAVRCPSAESLLRNRSRPEFVIQQLRSS